MVKFVPFEGVEGSCTSYSGPDPTKDADYSLIDTTNRQGIRINYKNAPKSTLVTDPSKVYFQVEI
jgi:hypothetical protein